MLEQKQMAQHNRQIAILLSALAFLGGSLVNAQTGDTWPPRPEDLFTASIEVVEVSPVADNEARVLYLYAANGWQAYPYPPDFSTVHTRYDYELEESLPSVYLRPDGQWLVFEEDPDSGISAWLLNPDSAHFDPIDLPCEITRTFSGYGKYFDQEVGWTIAAEPITQAWVFTWDGVHLRLCSILTGQKSEPLTDGRTYLNLSKVVTRNLWSIELPLVTPDGSRAIYTVVDETQGYPYYYRFYSYNLLTDQILNLGAVRPDPGEDIRITGWLDDRHFVISVSAMPEWSGRNVYVGDASRPDSIDFAASMLRFSPRTLSDPPSVEAMHAEMEDGPSAGPCYLTRYDALTRQRTHYDTGDLCEYGLPIPDGSGDRLYRALFPSMTLVRYNLQTGARTALFTGEIEWVGRVSPEGSYVVLGIGHSGTVEMGQDPDPNFDLGGCALFSDPGDCYETFIHQYVIVDLKTGRLVSEFPASASWFSDTSLLLTPLTGSHRLVYLDEGGREQLLPGRVVLSLPQRGQILLQESDGNFALYTVSTGQIVPVTKMATGTITVKRTSDRDILWFILRRSVELNSDQVYWSIRLP